MRHSMRHEMKIISKFTRWKLTFVIQICRCHHSIAKQLVSSRYFCHCYYILPSWWIDRFLIVSFLILQSNKPIMEKRRRARINNCLNELKTLILDAMKKDVSILLFLNTIWRTLIITEFKLKSFIFFLLPLMFGEVCSEKKNLIFFLVFINSRQDTQNWRRQIFLRWQ